MNAPTGKQKEIHGSGGTCFRRPATTLGQNRGRFVPFPMTRLQSAARAKTDRAEVDSKGWVQTYTQKWVASLRLLGVVERCTLLLTRGEVYRAGALASLVELTIRHFKARKAREEREGRTEQPCARETPREEQNAQAQRIGSATCE